MEASATARSEDANGHRCDDGPPPREVRMLHEVHDSFPEVDCYMLCKIFMCNGNIYMSCK